MRRDAAFARLTLAVGLASGPLGVVSVRLDAPVCMLRSVEGLSATPFPTDDWPGVTAQFVQ